MIRTMSRFGRLLLSTSLVAAFACSGDDNNIPGDQKATPVAPIFLFFNLSTNRTTLTADDTESFALLTVQANFADTGQPVANGTKVALTATLGGFDTPGGAGTLTLELFGGVGTVRYYAGGTEGVARIRGSLQGVLDTVEITIKPAADVGPVVPAPIATSMTLQVTPRTFVTGDDGPTDTLTLTALVIGTDGKPFKNAGVSFTSPVGALGTNATVKTNSAGVAETTLDVSDADISATSASSFTVTANLALVGGSFKTATFPVTIVRGPDPAVAATVSLSASPDFVDDDGGGAVIDLDALVQDLGGVEFAAGQVTFSSTLGTPSPQLDTSDSPVGHALSTLTLSGAAITAHPTNTFTVTATLTTPSGTTSDPKTITIVRPSTPLVADFTYSANPDSLGDMVVEFTDTSTGGPTSWAWDLDGDNVTDDANVPNPTFDYTGLVACDTINVTLVVSNGSGSDSVSQLLEVQPCP